ncbi:MAG: sigma-54-dependent Fis family transcriptional regulator [Desulfobacterales bacterium]|nr:sigma-54-dependent Fis family transcriptional regulator [Desulfobacterales bacterium]
MESYQLILVAESNQQDRDSITNFLRNLNYQVITAYDSDDALKNVKSAPLKLIISNFNMPGLDGLNLLDNISLQNKDIKTIFVSDNVSVDDAVMAMKAGAYDFLTKPLDFDQLALLVESVVIRSEEHKKIIEVKSDCVEIITKNSGILKLLSLAKQIAPSKASVLIQGESGTGKELFAKYIHYHSNRKNKPFIAVNCAAIPESLLESELFGYEKGAFTGAISKKAGKFELADSGTLLLDEITEMQYNLQSKLLRVLQENEVDRIGSKYPIKIDVRIIATTNRDIKELIKKGEFRDDLYFRLNVIPIKIPPLRERIDDIEWLAYYFIEKYNKIDGRNVKILTKETSKKLQSLNFSGNVRELENIIHRAVLLSDGNSIRPENLFLEDIDFEEETENLEEISNIPDDMMHGQLWEVEKKLIFHTLDKTKGNRTHAAKILGISVRTLRNKLNEYKEKI